MPANWADTPEKEKAWKRAKEIFKDQYDKEPSEDSDYAIVMTIAKNIHNKKENIMGKNDTIIDIDKETQIGDFLLEKGDKIRLLTEESVMFGGWNGGRNSDLLDAVSKHIGESARVFHIYNNEAGIRVVSNGTFAIQSGDIVVHRDKLDYFMIESEKIDKIDYRTDQGEYFIEVYMRDGYTITIDFRG